MAEQQMSKDEVGMQVPRGLIIYETVLSVASMAGSSGLSLYSLTEGNYMITAFGAASALAFGYLGHRFYKIGKEQRKGINNESKLESIVEKE